MWKHLQRALQVGCAAAQPRFAVLRRAALLSLGALGLSLFALNLLPLSSSKPLAPAPAEPRPVAAPLARGERVAEYTAALQQAADAAAELPRAHSLLVSWQGQLLLERYFNGRRAAGSDNIKSASKSVISALVGIALDRRLIPGLQTPISSFFPDLLAGDSGAKKAITIEDLLTMRSGLETTSNRNYGAWVQSRNWVQYALTRQLLDPPGTTMEYSTGNTHLLSAILTKATGQSTWQFAQESLATPLGFQIPQWPRDPQGIYFGGNDMLLTPRQMLAFGELYLRNGRYQDRQVVPERWVADSQVARTQSRRESDRYYGYGWWVRDLAGHPAYYAWGFGGQYIFIVPDLELVVVSTSASTVAEDRREHRFAIYDIIERLIVVPLASAADAA
jgi:CubicO group peptidase (beta-lactamase class C family)